MQFGGSFPLIFLEVFRFSFRTEQRTLKCGAKNFFWNNSAITIGIFFFFAFLVHCASVPAFFPINSTKKMPLRHRAGTEKKMLKIYPYSSAAQPLAGPMASSVMQLTV